MQCMRTLLQNEWTKSAVNQTKAKTGKLHYSLFDFFSIQFLYFFAYLLEIPDIIIYLVNEKKNESRVKGFHFIKQKGKWSVFSR